MSNSRSSRQPPDDLACCTPLARTPLGVEAAARVVPMLKAIADPTRLRLLSLVLSHEGAEACVCDLLPFFDLSQPTISHHLKVLHEAGLLDREKRGTWVFYLARPGAMVALSHLFTADASRPTDHPAGHPGGHPADHLSGHPAGHLAGATP